MARLYCLKNEKGFTLVELMVAVALTGLAVIGIYRAYVSFSQGADAQEQMLELQQNLRIGIYVLEADIRRAGMNEEEDENAGFVVATSNRVQFTMDLTGGELDGFDNDNDGGEDGLDPGLDENLYGDGDLLDAGEFLHYQRLDPDADGIFGLYRNDENANPGGDGIEIITNISALDFVYLDEDGAVLDFALAGATAPVAGSLDTGQMNRIRAVQVSLVIQTTNEDYRYTNREPYENLQATEIYRAPGDNLRRRMLNKQIKIRNMGL